MIVDQNARHIGTQISCRRNWGSLPFKRKLCFRYRRYFINGTLVLVVNSHLYIRSNRDNTCLDVILCNERITKALISLRRCAGWSAPLLFANPQRPVFLCGDPYVPFVDNGKCSKTLFSLCSQIKCCLSGLEFTKYLSEYAHFGHVPNGKSMFYSQIQGEYSQFKKKKYHHFVTS